MTYDEEALRAKQVELTALAEQAIEQHTTDKAPIAHLVVEAFADLSAPEKPPSYMRLIVLNVAKTPTASSRKAGNIYLNWKKLIDIVPDGTLAAAGATTGPSWLIPLAGLYIWNKLWCGSEEKLTEVEATVILALWKNKNSMNKILEEDGYEKTNVIRSDYSLPKLSKSSYESAINRLLKMKCVKLENGWLWLREWVRVTYS
jgi:hypothetical protein